MQWFIGGLGDSIVRVLNYRWMFYTIPQATKYFTQHHRLGGWMNPKARGEGGEIWNAWYDFHIHEFTASVFIYTRHTQDPTSQNSRMNKVKTSLFPPLGEELWTDDGYWGKKEHFSFGYWGWYISHKTVNTCTFIGSTNKT